MMYYCKAISGMLKLIKTKSWEIENVVVSSSSHYKTNLVEASVVQWLCHSPCKPGVAASIPGFSSP